MKTCGTCKNWLYDITSRSEREMNKEGYRPCALDPPERGRYLRDIEKACEKYDKKDKSKV